MRVLYIGHNSISSETNMGLTSKELLSGIPDDNISQIFIRGNVSPEKKINSLYMSEKGMITSIFLRRKNWIEIATNEEFNTIHTVQDTNKNDIVMRKRSSLKLLVRHLLWSISSWKSTNLINWVQEVNPDCIFFMPGDSTFIYDIAEYISVKTNTPIVTYFGDDNYKDSINKNNLAQSIYASFLNKSIERICSVSSGLVYISDSLKEKYESKFGVSGITVMTPYTQQLNKVEQKQCPPLLSYIGNLDSGRFSTMLQIVDIISEINKDEVKVSFEIFAPNLDMENQSKLNKDANYFKGVLKSEQVINQLIKSELLLHIESFEPEYQSSIMHSFSTKLANYLSSNRLIIAHGPSDVNSIRYLQEHQVALVSTNLVELKENILDITRDKIDIDNYVTRASKISNSNHNPEVNRKKIVNYIKEVI